MKYIRNTTQKIVTDEPVLSPETALIGYEFKGENPSGGFNWEKQVPVTIEYQEVD